MEETTKKHGDGNMLNTIVDKDPNIYIHDKSSNNASNFLNSSNFNHWE